MDISRGEQVEADLTRLIEKRDEKRPQAECERLEVELYEPSVRAWCERRETENRAAWCEYHTRRAAALRATLEDLISRHEEAAARLQIDESKGAA